MGGQKQHGAVLREDVLQTLHLLEEGVKLGVLAVGLVADEHGLGVGLPLEAFFLEAGLGQAGAVFLLGGADVVLGQAFSFSLVLGHLVLALAADPFEDRLAFFLGIVETAQADLGTHPQ